ncbi:nucleotidyl transferase AbiEii/AbiGii toxin family protein [Aliidiomarina iranensis]|uniref:Nucleotidyl transferase AbiEii/AbiGii toxin family protein n=1 Tax=Aliidiomarina iranensis TaxID=1434071 RepID=A0A432W0T7_9GAMM|nr:nucleotidyl transferase AbiEii/AbiGii toxin family protein [Aliidiomarina iranensis]RUO22602.1 nucleotidyl transferase AbiEii/AbiGii toxin family protein [Aliidiomarina iranensis]
MYLKPEIIDEIAAELAIDPAFVEKDWYSVQVLKVVAEHQSDSIETIFAGGTSLSKGYGLIQRFSEDLDFRCRYRTLSSGHQNKKARSAYRSSVLECIQTIDHIELDETKVKPASNYIKFPLSYPKQCGGHASLRRDLEIEFSFTQPQLQPQRMPIQSMVATFTGAAPETNILCLSPIETGADKFSALTWRILKRDRDHKQDDRAMVRHLHDLCALTPLLEEEHALFIETAITSFNIDQQSGKRDTNAEFYPSLKSALEQLKRDELYETEYQQFVDAMSYADDEKMITFERAMASFESMVSLFDV